MSGRSPYLRLDGPPNVEPGYAVAIVLDELCAWAMEHDLSGDDLRDRLEDSIERAEDES